ncbi:hypothetical protein ACO2Q2_03695 [Dyella sp. KRB-257]
MNHRAMLHDVGRTGEPVLETIPDAGPSSRQNCADGGPRPFRPTIGHDD